MRIWENIDAEKALSGSLSSEKVDSLWSILTTDFGGGRFPHSIFSDEKCSMYRKMLETNFKLAISRMIIDTYWEIHPEGCTSCYIDMLGLPINGFGIAVEIAIDLGINDIVEKMERTLTTLPWWEGNRLGVIGARALVRLIDNRAIHILEKYETWQSPKWECGCRPDRAIAEALSMLESQVTPWYIKRHHENDE